MPFDWSIISIITLILTALFCAVLMWTMRKGSRPKTILAINSTLLLVYLVLMAESWYEKLDFVYSLVCITITSLGYIYFRILIRPWKSNRKLIMLLCGLLAGVTSLYFILIAVCPAPPALNTFESIATGLRHPVVQLRIAVYFLFVVMMVVGIVKVYRMYRRHQDAIVAKFSFSKNVSLSWIPYMLVIYSLYGVLTIYDQLISGYSGWELVASNFIYAAFYLVINLIGVYQDDIYTEDEIKSENKQDVSKTRQLGTKDNCYDCVDDNRNVSGSDSGNGNVHGNGMSADMRFKLKNDMIHLMESKREYRNPELRLDNVAKMLNTNRSCVSTIIREDFNANFMGLVNSYRIREAKTLLEDSGTALSIKEIAFTTGFKSISSFYDFFKRETGISPLEFRRKYN